MELSLKNKDKSPQIWPVRSRQFYSWLQWRYYEQSGQLSDQPTVYLVVELSIDPEKERDIKAYETKN